MKTINRISNIATITLILGILLEIFYPAFAIMTLLSCAGIYVTTILKSRLQTGEFDIILCTLCTLSLAWMAARNHFDYSLTIVPGLFIMYAFLLRSFKLSTGTWNRAIIIYGTLSIVCGIVNVRRRLFYYFTKSLYGI